MIRDSLSAAAITIAVRSRRSWGLFLSTVVRAIGIVDHLLKRNLSKPHPRASGLVSGLHGESALWRLICAQVLIAQMLYSLRRLRRNCYVRVDHPGAVRIDVHLTVDFRDQLSAKQCQGRNEGHQVWALRRRSLRKPQ
jgi:hypothetical protein